MKTWFQVQGPAEMWGSLLIEVFCYRLFYNNSLKMIKPLTNNMIDILRHCRERELLNLEPYDVLNVRPASILIERGMLITKPYITKKGKKIFALFITYTGTNYLKKL
jgi:hypothetical protein